MCTAQSRYILIKYLSESGSSAKKRLVRVIHKTNILTQDSHPETNVGTEQKYLQDQYQPNAAPENKDLSSVKSMLLTSLKRVVLDAFLLILICLIFKQLV